MHEVEWTDEVVRENLWVYVSSVSPRISTLASTPYLYVCFTLSLHDMTTSPIQCALPRGSSMHLPCLLFLLFGITWGDKRETPCRQTIYVNRRVHQLGAQTEDTQALQAACRVLSYITCLSHYNKNRKNSHRLMAHNARRTHSSEIKSSSTSFLHHSDGFSGRIARLVYVSWEATVESCCSVPSISFHNVLKCIRFIMKR